MYFQFKTQTAISLQETNRLIMAENGISGSKENRPSFVTAGKEEITLDNIGKIKA